MTESLGRGVTRGNVYVCERPLWQLWGRPQGTGLELGHHRGATAWPAADYAGLEGCDRRGKGRPTRGTRSMSRLQGGQG